MEKIITTCVTLNIIAIIIFWCNYKLERFQQGTAFLIDAKRLKLYYWIFRYKVSKMMHAMKLFVLDRRFGRRRGKKVMHRSRTFAIDFCNLLLEEALNDATAESHVKGSAIEKFFRKKSKNNLLIISISSILSILYACLYTMFSMDVNCIIFIIFTALTWMITIYQVLLNYRIVSNCYGTNYEEAREMLLFIKNYKEINDNGNNGKGIFYENKEVKKLLNEYGKDQIEYIG